MAAAWLIFVLLLVGFAVGVAGTTSITWIRGRRQRRLDMYYRERNATKAVGEMPDVEDLIKSAMMRDADEEAPREVARTSFPGPLHSGSKSCVNISIDGYDALLRSTRASRGFSLSQAEEVMPVYDEELSEDAGTINDGDRGGEGAPFSEQDPDNATGEVDDDAPSGKADDEDPDTPWIPSNPNRLFPDGAPVDAAKSEMTEGTGLCAPRPTSTPVKQAPIGASVEPSGLDASARDILSNPDGRDRDSRVRSSFKCQFEDGSGQPGCWCCRCRCSRGPGPRFGDRYRGDWSCVKEQPGEERGPEPAPQQPVCDTTRRGGEGSHQGRNPGKMLVNSVCKC